MVSTDSPPSGPQEVPPEIAARNILQSKLIGHLLKFMRTSLGTRFAQLDCVTQETFAVQILSGNVHGTHQEAGPFGVWFQAPSSREQFVAVGRISHPGDISELMVEGIFHDMVTKGYFNPEVRNMEDFVSFLSKELEGKYPVAHVVEGVRAAEEKAIQPDQLGQQPGAPSLAA